MRMMRLINGLGIAAGAGSFSHDLGHGHLGWALFSLASIVLMIAVNMMLGDWKPDKERM